MRKILKKCLGVAAALLVANFAVGEVKAGLFNQCSPCEAVACNPCDAACDVGCGKKSGWVWGGWVEAGIYGNQWGQTNQYFPQAAGPNHNLDWASGNTAMLNNVKQTDFQMNQLWLYAGKNLDTRRGFDYGGRVDFVFGTDAVYTQSQGLEYTTRNNGPWGDGDYYTSFAQIYGEVGYKNVSVKVGKFLTPMGHESIMATERFFYSLSYQFAALPVTHTGALATWAPNKKLSVFGGWVNGQGLGSNGYNQYMPNNDLTFYNSDNNAALFGAKYELNKRIAIAYSAMIGRENNQWRVDGIDRDYFVQSFVVNVKPTKRWDYTFEWTLRNNNVDFGNGSWYSGCYGINNELIYRINKRWAVGGRFEWMHTYGTALNTAEGTDAYEFTLGANWTPRSWLLVRPELRYDKAYNGNINGPFSTYGTPRDDQFSGGVSAVVKY